MRWTDVRRIVDKLEKPKGIDIIFDKKARKDFVALLLVWARVTSEIAEYFGLGEGGLFGQRTTWPIFRSGLLSGIGLWQGIKREIGKTEDD